MSGTSIRTAAKRRLVDILTQDPALNGVQVVYGWSGPEPEDDHIRVGAPPTTGVTARAVFSGGGRDQREDRFSLSVYIFAHGAGRSHEEAEERCEALYAVIEDVLASNDTLDDLDGLIGAVIAGVDGPDSWPTTEGASADMRAAVDLHAFMS